MQGDLTNMIKTFKIKIELANIELKGTETYKQILKGDLEAFGYLVHIIDEIKDET